MRKVVRGPVGRFQVMAILQAARAHVLGLPVESAKSFGLNRAIFYAAAKKGFIGTKKGESKPKTLEIKKKVKEKPEEILKTFEVYQLGDEMAYSVKIGDRVYFTIGGQVQTEEDFKKQVERRFGDKFEKAWQEALEIVKQYDRGVLLSQRYFYETVYKPRRDLLAEKWSKMVQEGKEL